MSKILTIIAVIILILHGLIHLMGTLTYMKLGTVEGLKYKTTLLGGRCDLGEKGIGIYGALWGVAALGFIVSGLGMLAGWSWIPPMLVSVTIFSLIITALDWEAAFAGVIVNGVILLIWKFGSQLVGLFSQ